MDRCFETRPRVNCAKVFGLLVIWLGPGGQKGRLMGRLGDSKGQGKCVVGPRGSRATSMWSHGVNNGDLMALLMICEAYMPM